jgi:23S rRNA-/tRNA-specific pseudouridylate synthase
LSDSIEEQDRIRRYETPVDMPRLIKQDGAVFVIYKPAGLPVHPGTPGVASLKSWLESNLSKDVAPVHRLDAPVSGLVLCADDRETRKMLSKLFEMRDLTKTYLALVHGRSRRKGIIRKELKDQRRQRTIEAVTRYKLEQWFDRCSLLSVRPETGRKHQIRRHLHMIGHGIVGDQRYRSHKTIGVPIDRLWLHAHKLELPDGRIFECPLTERLTDHLALLKAAVPVEPGNSNPTTV